MVYYLQGRYEAKMKGYKMAEIIKVNDDTYRFEDGTVRFFLFCGSEKAALIDTGMSTPEARELAEGLTDLPLILINTHADPDHISGNAAFDEFYMNPAEEKNYRDHGGQGEFIPVHEGDVIDLGDRKLIVIEIPGHTAGSIALLDEKNRVLVGGDTVQDGFIFMFGERRNMGMFIESLRHLKEYEDKFDEIYPMHGSFPVKPDLIDQLISGATEVQNGVATGSKVNVMGTDICYYKYPYAGFLCDLTED